MGWVEEGACCMPLHTCMHAHEVGLGTFPSGGLEVGRHAFPLACTFPGAGGTLRHGPAQGKLAGWAGAHALPPPLSAWLSLRQNPLALSIPCPTHSPFAGGKITRLPSQGLEGRQRLYVTARLPLQPSSFPKMEKAVAQCVMGGEGRKERRNKMNLQCILFWRLHFLLTHTV